MQKKWKYLPANNSENYEKIRQITQNDLLAKLLISRGIDTEKKALEYLEPVKMELTSPYDFTDMEIAVERILKAVENGEFILIHGDFDADGITSTALLSKLMTLLKANFDIYIPNRETESHGLSTKAVLKKKAKNNLKLVITCDCATNDVKEIQLLKSLGVETIVTDHHEASGELPEAIAIINPKIENKVNENLSADKLEHLCELAGVGVAFKLACAILGKIGQQNFVDELFPLVAVGTIADVVPVLGENRYFIKKGIEEIQKGKNRGLFELLKSAGINPQENLKSENIAFMVAPRLNATGRLDTADEGYRLLISDNGSEIEFLCNELNNKNSLRQTLCDKIFKEAVDLYENSDDKNQYAIVLYKEDWHLGVIGIVASKLAGKYNKPVLMMCKDPNSDFIRSSVRSIDAINIFEMLNEMKEYFTTFGGHKGAAGLSFDPKEHPFEQIKQRVFELAREYSQDLDLTPVLNIDLKIEPKDLTQELIEKLEVLEPCGAQNPYPVFAIENLDLQEQKLIGQKQNHLKFICKTPNNDSLECVFWNNPLIEKTSESKIDIAFYPKLNTFNNLTSLQLDIQDAHYEEPKKIFNIYDHRKKRDILPQVCDFVNKNVEKISIYLKSLPYKNNLIKMGFPEEAFEIKPNGRHLMFFEYPDNEKEFKTVIEKTNPQNLHFMNCENKISSLNDLIGKILGMTKYAAHNKKGEFDINSASKNLGIKPEIISLTLQILNEINAIKINSFENGAYNIEYLKPISYEEVMDCDTFEELKEEFERRIKFQEQILSANENEIIELLN